MAAKDVLGRRGEDLAAAWAQGRGWTVLARNWRGERGELDLVARDADCIVVLEVKTRSSLAFGGPLAAVTPRKVARLRALTGEWLARARSGAEAFPDGFGIAGARQVRIDVLAVLWPEHEVPRLIHVRSVG